MEEVTARCIGQGGCQKLEWPGDGLARIGESSLPRQWRICCLEGSVVTALGEDLCGRFDGIAADS